VWGTSLDSKKETTIAEFQKKKKDFEEKAVRGRERVAPKNRTKCFREFESRGSEKQLGETSAKEGLYQERKKWAMRASGQ